MQLSDLKIFLRSMDLTGTDLWEENENVILCTQHNFNSATNSQNIFPFFKTFTDLATETLHKDLQMLLHKYVCLLHNCRIIKFDVI